MTPKIVPGAKETVRCRGSVIRSAMLRPKTMRCSILPAIQVRSTSVGWGCGGRLDDDLGSLMAWFLCYFDERRARGRIAVCGQWRDVRGHRMRALAVAGAPR